MSTLNLLYNLIKRKIDYLEIYSSQIMILTKYLNQKFMRTIKIKYIHL